MHPKNYAVGIAISALLALAVLTGCGGSNSSNTLTTVPNADGRALPAPQPLTGLTGSVTTDKTTYKVGDPIAITVSITNNSANAHTVAFPSGSKTVWWGYIIAQNGKIVTYEYWTGHNLGLTTDIGVDTYAAGATHTFSWTFPYTPDPSSPPLVASLPAGTYQIYVREPDLTYDGTQAVRTDAPTPFSSPVTITVTN